MGLECITAAQQMAKESGLSIAALVMGSNADGLASQVKNYDINEVYKRELDHFIKCVKNNKKSINDVGEGINVLKIALSVIKSSKIKKMVHVK